MKKMLWEWGWMLLFLAGCAAPALQTTQPKDAFLPLKTGLIKSNAPLLSWKALRDKDVVRQRYDYSCGSAALATLLRYYFDDPVEERDILIGLLDRMSPEEIRDRVEKGLSLLDLKRYAEQRGYQAVGVKLSLSALPQLKGPILIHLEKEEDKHFAVLKGVRGDRVYLADPSRGNIRLSVERFAREWSGTALILGRRGLGLSENHPLALEEQEPVQNELLEARRALFLK